MIAITPTSPSPMLNDNKHRKDIPTSKDAEKKEDEQEEPKDITPTPPSAGNGIYLDIIV